jgi:hypothetical protein
MANCTVILVEGVIVVNVAVADDIDCEVGVDCGVDARADKYLITIFPSVFE